MRIVADVMGGDQAPVAVIKGAVMALERDAGLTMVLCGPKAVIERELGYLKAPRDRIEIVDAPDVIEMAEAPVTAIRQKKNSSLVVGMNLVAGGQGDGFISAGSTGAVLAGATFIIKRIKGINRPALAPILPAKNDGHVLLIDCGANVDCKSEFLRQFALMGDAYMRTVTNVPEPRVALINNGAEPEKGNELTKEAYKLLEKEPSIQFMGNLEPRYILSGAADVVVCDGFVGNMLLKSLEGASVFIFDSLKDIFMQSFATKIGAMILKPKLRTFKRTMDYTEYGGAPLLGVAKPVVKAHGSSNARAYSNAIAQLAQMIRGDVVGKIAQSLQVSADQQ